MWKSTPWKDLVDDVSVRIIRELVGEEREVPGRVLLGPRIEWAPAAAVVRAAEVPHNAPGSDVELVLRDDEGDPDFRRVAGLPFPHRREVDGRQPEEFG